MCSVKMAAEVLFIGRFAHECWKKEIDLWSGIIISSTNIFTFFFQAEDGIRYLYVTGVQTCALPISGAGHEADTQEAQRGVQSQGGAGGDQGGSDDCRAGEWVRGSSEPDLQLEEAAAGRGGEGVRGRRFGGRNGQRGRGRCSVPANRPVEGRKRFFGAKARQMSRAERRAQVERTDPPLPVSQQCRLLAVSRSSVYRRPAKVGEEDLAIMVLIDRQYLARPYYGSRRMAAWLATQGHMVNRKRVQRLMRLMGLVAIYQRPNTSKAAAAHKVYPYLLGGIAIERVNQVWSSDVTYIPMAKGFLYLVVIMDWMSRAVLAWRLSNTLGAEFCVEALEEALFRYGRPEIFNTDQGSQFTSNDFTGTLERHEVTISMDGKGRYMDNIFVERLWRSLKYEEVYLNAYASVAEAKAGIGAWLDFYNEERQHQSLRYRTPRQIYEEGPWICGR